MFAKIRSKIDGHSSSDKILKYLIFKLVELNQHIEWKCYMLSHGNSVFRMTYVVCRGCPECVNVRSDQFRHCVKCRGIFCEKCWAHTCAKSVYCPKCTNTGYISFGNVPELVLKFIVCILIEEKQCSEHKHTWLNNLFSSK